MGHRDPDRPSRHEHSSHTKRHGDRERTGSRKKRRREDEEEEEDMWVEKPIAPSTSNRSETRESPSAQNPAPPADVPTVSKLQRDDWMLEPGERKGVVHRPATVGSVADALHTGGTFEVNGMPERRDWGTRERENLTEGYGDSDDAPRSLNYFASLGKEKEKKPKEEAPNPDKPTMSRYELNKQIYDVDGRRKDDPEPTGLQTAARSARPTVEPGSAGWDWRMKKLQRTIEAAQEDNRPLVEVGIERYGSLEAFEEAQAERLYIDERDARRRGQGRGVDIVGPGVDEFGREIRRTETPPPSSASVTNRFLYNQSMGDSSGSASRPLSRGNSFRRPGDRADTPQTATSRAPTKPSTPVPQVFTPTAPRGRSGLVQAGPQTNADDGPAPLSPTSLNRLQARVLKAKLMGAPDAAELEAQYTAALKGSQNHQDLAGDATEIRALPTLDAQGRLYDVGPSPSSSSAAAAEGQQQPSGPGNRKKKEATLQTHDPQTGELLRLNADDDTTTIDEMVRQERFSAGMADQKNMDAEFASRIAGDSRFNADLDYIDDNAEQLARKKMRTDAQKRMFAINDYARTQKALDTCPYCFQETAAKPRVPLVALGTRTYLALTQNEGLVDGHCLIVPIQHHLSTLEADDDTWEEIRNFMKTLMQAFAGRDQGVIFFETVTSMRQQRHSVIECVPVPWEIYEEAPAYFREGILASEMEWSQHKKLIDFAARPGGFRRSMVPNLPYFAIFWDYKCDKGYGHIIEGIDKNHEEEDAYDVDENARSGASEFSRTFAQETLGQMMQLESRRWRRPKRLGAELDTERAAKFKKAIYTSRFDWTKLLIEQQQT